MTQEERDLLLKDLCARLPYGVKVQYQVGSQLPSIKRFNARQYDELRNGSYIDDWLKCTFKPCLYPLSSMTEEQRKELEDMGWSFDNFEINNINECLGTYREYVSHSDCFTLIDWCNKNNFDYRGLIPMGLAIDCTNLSIY